MLNLCCLYHLANKTSNNMRNVILIVLIFFMSSVFSQNALRFNNIITKDTVWLFENDKVIIQYKGYLKQNEEVKARVLQINDSNIVLGSKIFGVLTVNKTIKISDIEGFKRFSRARRILKTTLSVGVVVGSIFLPEAIGVTSSLGIYATTVAAGLVGVGVIELIFSSKVKNTLNTGWQYNIMYPKKNQ